MIRPIAAMPLRYPAVLLSTAVILAVMAGVPAAQTPDSTTTDTRSLSLTDAGQEREATFEEKEAALTARVEADHSDGVAWNDLGVLYTTEDRFVEARDSFIRAIQTSAQVGDYHRNLGLAFSRLGEFDLAVAEYSAYRRFDLYGGKDYWRLIGQAQLRAGLPEAARVTFK